MGEASGKEESHYIGEIAKAYLKDPDRDTTFGIRNEEGLHYIGNKQGTIFDNKIIIGDEKFKGTSRLWELIMSKNPQGFKNEDYDNYTSLMLKPSALHRDNKPKRLYPKSSSSDKWKLITYIWAKSGEYEGKGLWLFRAILTRC